MIKPGTLDWRRQPLLEAGIGGSPAPWRSSSIAGPRAHGSGGRLRSIMPRPRSIFERAMYLAAEAELGYSLSALTMPELRLPQTVGELPPGRCCRSRTRCPCRSPPLVLMGQSSTKVRRRQAPIVAVRHQRRAASHRLEQADPQVLGRHRWSRRRLSCQPSAGAEGTSLRRITRFSSTI